MTSLTAVERPVEEALSSSPRAFLAVRRVGATIGTAITVFVLATFATFALGAASGSNPAVVVLGEFATPEDIERLGQVFGLDRPFLVRYFDWLFSAVTGDLGTSWLTTLPVAQSIGQALPVSLSIAAGAMLVALVFGSAAGITAALTRGSILDRAITVVSTAASTVPAFVAAIALILVFAHFLPIFPVAGYTPASQSVSGWLLCLVLPSVALSLDAAADIARQLRTSLVGTLEENFIIGARVHGLGHTRIVFGHALPNSIAPALSILGVHAPRLIGGAVITEVIFGMPGIGQLANRAAMQGDVPVVQGVLLVSILAVVLTGVVINLVLARLSGTERSAT